MRRSFLPLACASFALTATLAMSQASHAAEPIQVVQVGDRTKSCEVLAGEINALSQPAATTAAAKPKKKGFGFLKAALSTAVPFVGMGNAIGGALLSSAAGAAQTAAAEGAAKNSMDEARQQAVEAMAGPSASEQRKARLTGIFEEKRC